MSIIQKIASCASCGSPILNLGNILTNSSKTGPIVKTFVSPKSFHINHVYNKIILFLIFSL